MKMINLAIEEKEKKVIINFKKEKEIITLVYEFDDDIEDSTIEDVLCSDIDLKRAILKAIINGNNIKNKYLSLYKKISKQLPEFLTQRIYYKGN